eukprot:50662-Chlamydomonas_euryale.AAC.1
MGKTHKTAWHLLPLQLHHWSEAIAPGPSAPGAVSLSRLGGPSPVRGNRRLEVIAAFRPSPVRGHRCSGAIAARASSLPARRHCGRECRTGQPGGRHAIGALQSGAGMQ